MAAGGERPRRLPQADDFGSARNGLSFATAAGPRRSKNARGAAATGWIGPPMSIAVAMATYNGARFLPAQLASLSAQTRPPAELVACDDGSRDDTPAILDHFARTAPFPVRVERKSQRLGYRGNFLKAAGMCRAPLIAFCDQDDVWEPTKLERVAAPFSDPATLLVTHAARLMGPDDMPGARFDTAPGLGEDDEGIVNAPWPLVYGFAMTFRRTLLAHSDLWHGSVSDWAPDENIGHDRWILFLSAALGRFVRLPDELVRYRQHDANAFGAAPAPTAPPPVVARLRALRMERRWIDRRARAAADRLRVLRSLADRVGGAERLHRLTRRFAAFEARLTLRRKVYDDADLAARARAFAALVHGGDYRDHDPWRFPRRKAAKDAMIALWGPPSA